MWIQANVHVARPLTSHWMDCNWLILSSWLILQPAKLVGVSLADVIDKQRRGEGKVRRDSISARLKNLLSSRSLDKSLRISKPSSRFGESSELELFDIREIENWSFVRNTTRPAHWCWPAATTRLRSDQINAFPVSPQPISNHKKTFILQYECCLKLLKILDT